MRDELETGTDCYIDPKFFFDHSSTSFSSWLDYSTVGHWGPKALCLPLALTSASCPQLTRTAPGTWLYYYLCPPASAVLPLIYTGTSLDWRFSRGSLSRMTQKLNFKENQRLLILTSISFISLFMCDDVKKQLKNKVWENSSKNSWLSVVHLFIYFQHFHYVYKQAKTVFHCKKKKEL